MFKGSKYDRSSLFGLSWEPLRMRAEFRYNGMQNNVPEADTFEQMCPLPGH